MVAVNKQSQFTIRPEIGAAYRSPMGELLTVAAVWESGVVFEGVERTVDAITLLQRYVPWCEECAAYHEPEYPHLLTDAFIRTFSHTHGREPTRNDTTKDIEPGLAHWFALAQQPEGAVA